MADIFLRPHILKSVIIKEFKQILRDKRMRFLLLGSPIIMLFIFGYAVNTDVTEVKMAVLDADRTSVSRNFISKFTESKYFVHYASLESPKEADYYLDSWQADMYIHIPKNFKANLVSGKTAEVQIILDGTDSTRASVISAYINQITAEFSAIYIAGKVRAILLSRENLDTRIGEQLVLKERVMFNPELTSRNFYLPGILCLLTTLVTIMLTSMSVVKERESGTMEQIIVSPLKPIEFVAGKTLPFAIIGLVEICFITLITLLWFKVPFAGNFFFLIFASGFYILCTLSVGLYISTVSQTQQQAVLSTFLFFIPAILLSGFIFPIYAMPEVFHYITMLNPMRYFMTIIRGVFLKGVGLTVLWKDVAALLLLGSALIFFSMKRFSRRFE